MVGDMSGSCPLPKGKVPGVWCHFPAISQPLWGQLYGWLPLSNAYGIFYCKIRPNLLLDFQHLNIEELCRILKVDYKRYSI